MQTLPIPALAPVLDKHGTESRNLPESKGCLCLGGGRCDFWGSLFLYVSGNCRVTADGADARGGACHCCLPRGEANASQDGSKLPRCCPHDGLLFLDALLALSFSPWHREAREEQSCLRWVPRVRRRFPLLLGRQLPPCS